MKEIYEVYYLEYLIGILQVDLLTSKYIYKPNKEVNNLKEKYSLLKVLIDANSGYIKDVPFFENRINYMKEYHLSEIKYMTDNVLIKRVV